MPAANVAKPGKAQKVEHTLVSPFDEVELNNSAAPSPFDVSESARKSRSEPKAVRENARYFVITSNSAENVVRSVRHNVWATQRKNESKLDEAYRSGAQVILLFSVQRSEAYQGYAQMRSAVGRSKLKGADPFNGFGRLFDVEWLRLYDLPFREVQHLRNPLAEDGKVTMSRDGQELANSVGHRLCSMIDKHIDQPDSFPLQEVSSFQASADGGSIKRRKFQHAPHPLEDGFEKQVDFFLSMQYEDYVEWWKHYGASSPGPTPPP